MHCNAPAALLRLLLLSIKSHARSALKPGFTAACSESGSCCCCTLIRVLSGHQLSEPVACPPAYSIMIASCICTMTARRSPVFIGTCLLACHICTMRAPLLTNDCCQNELRNDSSSLQHGRAFHVAHVTAHAVSMCHCSTYDVCNGQWNDKVTPCIHSLGSLMTHFWYGPVDQCQYT